MKKHLLTLLVSTPLFIYAQQTYTWAVSSGSWSTASNWLPARNIPAADDILEFNTTAIVTNLPTTETIGKLRVYSNAAVTFSAASESTINIGNPTATAPHFMIAAGSSLSIAGSNIISINIGSSYTGQIDGSLSFLDAAHKLTASSTNAIIFSTGSTFIADAGFSGNAFGNTTANRNTVVFQSGSTYIRKDGGNPFGLTAPDAVTIFNNGSIYRHQVNGTGPSMAGRTYGNLYVEANINFAGIGSSRDCIIQNDLNVLSGFFSFKPNSLGSHTGNFNIYGNILASGTSYIDIGSGNMPGAVQLLGSNQNIGGGGGAGTISLQHLTLNNISTTLVRPLSVSGILKLDNGKMITTASSLLELSATAAIQSCAHDYFNLAYSNMGCNNSYVEGPMKKSGLVAGNFVFPVGKNGKLRPLILKNATGNFTVSYERSDPYLALGSSMGPGIHHVSHLEYWNVDGTGPSQVELTFFDPNSGGVTDMNALRVSRYNGSVWTDAGTGSFTGTAGANGSVTSNNLVTFGSFTLAGATNYPNNPLPVKSFLFQATQYQAVVKLEWGVADIGEYRGYYIQRASGNDSFIGISGYIQSKNTDNSNYCIYDSAAKPGKNLYRIKIIGVNGNVYFSNVQTVYYQGSGKLIVYPNPAREKIFIKNPFSSSISDLVIVNISGSVVKRVKVKSQTTVEINVLNLLPGIYFIKSVQLSSPVIVKFIKF